ncbi:hypothetical protein HYH03_004809 [Edaphochlamys debaryana]|uniref:Uncharacterized protein n=1 Tax=Edaphochlamys debaryana TaxID=47281 RepID=A0A835Y6P4_9CHLO|nr:hypothetical protein HYH03_004809 [Edaphochlamys debaryana]|eukprot:KAG2497220.1 hypothetical protein HYH03_004809 [Edaphochlamys debaryana]
MGPSLDPEVLRGKDGGIFDVYRQLAEARGTPAAADKWLGTARAALAIGEVERARTFLEGFLESDRNNLPAQLLLAKTYQTLGTEEALDDSVAVARSALSHAKAADDVLSATTQLALALGTRARVHTRQQHDRQQDRAEAEQLLSSALTSAPSTSGPAVAAARYSLAVLQAEQGTGAAAMATARDALREAQAVRDNQLTALCLLLVSSLLSSRRQTKLALQVLSAAPSQAGAAEGSLWSDVFVLRLRARLLDVRGDVPGSLEALAQCKRVLSGWAEGRAPLPAGVSRGEVEAALIELWGELAQALAKSGQAAEAMAAADHALALSPWAAPARAALGAVHEALGEPEAAAAAYGDALALDPTHAPALLRQGAMYARRGGRSELAVARDMLAEALRYDPACAAAWYQLGRVALGLEHRAEAEEHLLTAVRLAAAAPALPFSSLPLAPPQAAA